MSVRVRYTVTVSVSSTSAEERDLCNCKYEVVVDSQSEGGSWKTVVPVSTTDVQLQMGNVAQARFVVIRTNAKDPTKIPGPLLLRKNSISGEQIQVTPLSGAREGHMVLATDGITSLYATNASVTVDMDVTLILAGD